MERLSHSRLAVLQLLIDLNRQKERCLQAEIGSEETTPHERLQAITNLAHLLQNMKALNKELAEYKPQRSRALQSAYLLFMALRDRHRQSACT